MLKNEARPLSYTKHENQLNLKNLKVRPGTVKFLEETIGSNLTVIGLSSVLWGRGSEWGFRADGVAIGRRNDFQKWLWSQRQKFKSAGILQMTNRPVDSICSLSYRELPSTMTSPI